MNTVLKAFTIAAIACFTITNVFAQANYTKITGYSVYYGTAKRFGQTWMALRKFTNNGRDYLFLVNPKTLETRTDEAKGYEVTPMTIAQTRDYFKNSPYQNAIIKAEGASVALQDAGIERGLPKETGISLTADLCPSHHPLDRRIFTDIISGFKQVETPVPIALSVSGLWMRHHQQDIAWLKQLQAKHEIYITWINHSFNHRVSAKSPLKTNFLLEPGTDINYEVLETEKAMLANGLQPSVFFRFPGLVSDQQLVYKITDFGLIPIGTDAWLAKGQQPQSGSIVLIHGNGNEPLGVNDFIKLLQSKAKLIANKQWLLYDLRETVDEEFESKK
ncbi:polysaccharide deacetylase family protein [Mucilaginibacter glaciei]|uniref:Polysaccharide deacetylase n=1 Tax=Mucilaginibacter glaciei TaxID=2772109 RepID=A0A926NYJ2_9SPHI|nr:polysaccharide deacetylase [Mucilaginibacter glaciei]MBD1394243.1 polysaccharide deacetylase [Mucilaginibacter glaciei]